MARREFLTRLSQIAALPFLTAGAMKAQASKKPLKVMMKSAWGSDDPTKAAFPFSHGLALSEAGHDVQIYLLGEAVSLMRSSVAKAVVPVGWPPLAEVLDKVVAKKIQIYACGACSRVAVRRCLPPVHRTESARTACTRSAIASHTGRGRGAASTFRAGAAWSTYFPTVVRERPSSRATARCVRPSTSTLCRTTCTRSILSILSANPRSLDPASPQSGPQVAYFPSGVWLTF